jgi:hypothetical protein
MAAGFVVAISKRWKGPERDCRDWHRNRAENDFGLGAVWLASGRRPTVPLQDTASGALILGEPEPLGVT